MEEPSRFLFALLMQIEQNNEGRKYTKIGEPCNQRVIRIGIQGRGERSAYIVYCMCEDDKEKRSCFLDKISEDDPHDRGINALNKTAVPDAE